MSRDASKKILSVPFRSQPPPYIAMTDLSDKELLDLLAGDEREDAFSQLVSRYTNLVYNSALRQLNNWAAAQDVTQAVFLILWNKGRSLRDAAALPAWLLSATRLACLDAIKRKIAQQRHEQKASVMPSQNSLMDSTELAANLDQILSRLPATDRAAVARRYLMGQSFQEVAVSLGISTDAAKKRVARALTRLRQHLARRGLTSPADLLENSLLALPIIATPPGLIPAIHANCAGHSSASITALSEGVQMSLTAITIKSGAVVAAAVGGVLIAGVALSVKSQGVVTVANPVTTQVATANSTTLPASTPPAKSDDVVYISGSVQRPGVYGLSQYSENLLQSVFRAALNDDVNFDTAQLKVIRKVEGKSPVTAYFSLRALLDGKTDPPVLQGGDMIQVLKSPSPAMVNSQLLPPPIPVTPTEPISNTVCIDGSVERPGAYSIEETLTTATQLLEAAKLSKKVNLETATFTIIRPTGPHTASKSSYSLKDLVTAKLTLPLEPGDIILVSK